MTKHNDSFHDNEPKSDDVKRMPLPKGKAETDPGVKKHHASVEHQNAGNGKLEKGKADK